MRHLNRAGLHRHVLTSRTAEARVCSPTILACLGPLAAFGNDNHLGCRCHCFTGAGQTCLKKVFIGRAIRTQPCPRWVVGAGDESPRTLHHTCNESRMPSRDLVVCKSCWCAGVRFRLLLLALQHCKQTQRHGRHLKGQTCPGHIALLFDRILATALQTFRAPPAWYGKWSKEQARYTEYRHELCMGTSRWCLISCLRVRFCTTLVSLVYR